jgi:hypothetical protein
VATDRGSWIGRLLLITASLGLIVAGGVTVLRFAAGPPSAAAEHPVSLPTSTVAPAPVSPAATHSSTSTAPAPKPRVPVAIDIPVAGANHPNGVRAKVTAHPLNADRTLYVPPDPTEVAWASEDAMPGSARGTAILVSHVNFVVAGRTVAGAFADLAEYARTAVGKTLTVTLADHRTLAYRIVAGREYAKQQLGEDPQLRRTLYDQSAVYGSSAHPSGRLLLVSCGGDFDPTTGSYEDNVFLYALPMLSPATERSPATR